MHYVRDQKSDSSETVRSGTALPAQRALFSFSGKHPVALYSPESQVSEPERRT